MPTKMSSSRHNVLWMTTHIRRMTRKKQRLYNRASKAKNNKEHHWAVYKAHKKATEKALRTARWKYINGILQKSLDEGNSKPFWRYL